jgi:hypothetical protein
MSRIRYKNSTGIASVYFIIVLAVLNEPVFAARARRKSNSNINRTKTRQVARPTISSKKPRTINAKTALHRNNSVSLRRPSVINNISRKVKSISINRKQSTIKNMGRSGVGITKHTGSSAISRKPQVLNKAKQPNMTSNPDCRQTSIRSRSTGTAQFSRSSISTKSSFNSAEKPAGINVNSNDRITTSKKIGAFINGKKSFFSTNSSKPEIVSDYRLGSSVDTNIRLSVNGVKQPVQDMRIQSPIVRRKQLSPNVRQTIGSFVRRKETPPLNHARENQVNKRPSVSAEERKPHRSERKALVTNEAIDDKRAFIANRSEGIGYNKKNATKTGIKEMHKGTDDRISKESLPRLRLKKDVSDGRRNLIREMSRDDHKVRQRTRIHRYEAERCPQKIYRGQPHTAQRINRYLHIYRDCHDRLCHRIIWPRYRFLVSYRYGPYFTFSFVYPYYHRKYVFISLGGFWPIEYSYIRYYWYGCHPYIWCGYYPIAHEVQGDTYNYYTYNYYNNEDVSTGHQSEQQGSEDYIEPVDHTTFADVHEKLAEQAGEPDAVTPADILFEEAVKSFESEDYVTAIEKFSKAMELAPEDTVLPFAYAQALFADEQYYQAAEVIREALSKVSPEKQGVFYPRGLYPNDELLFEQIERLAEKAEQESDNANLQLLLGYHYLGTGQLDAASEPLKVAGQDLKNGPAAEVLLDLLRRIKADNAVQNEVSDVNRSQPDSTVGDSEQ